jgi:hypothetical protein
MIPSTRVFLFPMIRYAGLFCNRWKKQYLAFTRLALNQQQPDDPNANASSSWAERQKDYTGAHPLVCPNCHEPLTFIGTFFGNWTLLQSLFAASGKDSTIAPALLRSG